MIITLLILISTSASAVTVTFDECKLAGQPYIDHYWDQCLPVRAKGIRLQYPDRVIKDTRNASNQVLDSSGEFRVDFTDYNGTPLGLPYDVTRFSVTLYDLPAGGSVRYYTRDKNFRISPLQFISGPGNKTITLTGEFREVFVENRFVGPPWLGLVDNISFDRKDGGGGGDSGCDPEVAVACLHFLNPFLLGADDDDPRNLDLRGFLSRAPDLTTAGASGLAADGASAAIAVYGTADVSSGVTFTTNNGTSLFPYASNFLTTTPSVGSSTLTIPASQFLKIGSLFYAAVFVQAPLQGVNHSLSDVVTVTATQSGSTEQEPLALLPPPVVLVHGLWGNKESLAPLQTYLRETPPWQYHPSFVQAIEYLNTARFDDPGPTGKLRAAIQSAVKNLNSQHIVASRVDIVAHSMGGLVSRSYANASDYRTTSNRRQGNFSNIITLDTPENGSKLANFLVANRNKRFINRDSSGLLTPKTVWEKAGCSTTMTVQQCFQASKQPLSPPGKPIEQGAVFSLQPGSPSFRNVAPPNIPNATWRAVSATVPNVSGTRGQSVVELFLDQLIAGIYPSVAKAKTVTSILGGSRAHDGIVTLTSQIYQAPRANMTTFNGLAHSHFPKLDFFQDLYIGPSYNNVVDSPAVHALVACWLIKDGDPSCRPATRTHAVEVAAAEAGVQYRERWPYQVPVQFPKQAQLATPFEVAISLPTRGEPTLLLEQEDELGNFIDPRPLKVTRVVGQTAYVSVTPLLMGEVKFSIRIRQPTLYASAQEVTIPVGLPAAQPKTFTGDMFNIVSLTPQGLGSSTLLRPWAVFPGLPDEVFPGVPGEVSLDGRVAYRLAPDSSTNVIRVSPKGEVEAIGVGVAIVEAHFGPWVALVNVYVERKHD